MMSHPSGPNTRHAQARPTRIYALLCLLAAIACLPVHAHADPLPPCTATTFLAQESQSNCAISNPGGSSIITAAFTADITYVDTATTNTVDDSSTTLVGLVNGSQVYSMTFLVPFSDSSIMSAIATVDGILSGDGATFGAPSLISNTSVLQSSVVTAPPTYDCASALASNDATGGFSTVTTTTFRAADHQHRRVQRRYIRDQRRADRCKCRHYFPVLHTRPNGYHQYLPGFADL